MDVLSDVWIGVLMNMLLGELGAGMGVNAEVILLAAAVTDLVSAVSLLYDVDMVAGSVIKIGLSNVWTAVLTALEFAVSSSLEESLIFG